MVCRKKWVETFPQIDSHPRQSVFSSEEIKEIERFQDKCKSWLFTPTSIVCKCHQILNNVFFRHSTFTKVREYVYRLHSTIVESGPDAGKSFFSLNEFHLNEKSDHYKRVYTTGGHEILNIDPHEVPQTLPESLEEIYTYGKTNNDANSPTIDVHHRIPRFRNLDDFDG